MSISTGTIRFSAVVAACSALIVLLAGCRGSGETPSGGAALGTVPGSAPPTTTYYALGPVAALNPFDLPMPGSPPSGPPDGCVPQTTDISDDSTAQAMQAVRADFDDSCGFSVTKETAPATFLPLTTYSFDSANYDDQRDVDLSFGDGQVTYLVSVIHGDRFLAIINPVGDSDVGSAPIGSATPEDLAAIRREYGSDANTNAIYDQWVKLTASQWSALDSGDGPGAPFAGYYTFSAMADAITDDHGLGWAERGSPASELGDTHFTFTRPSAYANVPGAVLRVDPATGLALGIGEDSDPSAGYAIGFTSAADSVPLAIPVTYIDGSTL